MKRARRNFEPAAIGLIEESVHLLRGAPAATLAVYYSGAVPFTLGVLFYWAYTSWFQPTGERLAWGALGLVILFAGMKTAQAEFCARLWAIRLGTAAPEWTWRRRGRVAFAQMCLQPWALLVLLVTAPIGVPLGWVYAYAQNLVVLGDGDRLHAEASEQAQLWPEQNHFGLLMILLLSFGVWINLGAAFLAVPWLANRLLGIENIFGFSGWWFFNSTFLASVTALTWLAVDPLLKAYYTLRVFHGRARRDGEDVRVELQLARRTRAGAMRMATGLALLAFLSLPSAGRAAVGPAPTPRAVQPAELDRAIESVLAGPEFSWRLRPPAVKQAKQPEGPVKRFVRQGFDAVAHSLRAVGRWMKSVVDWVERHLTGDRIGRERVGASGAGALTTLRAGLYLFLALAGGLLLWVLWLMLRQARRPGVPVLVARAVAAAVPDLREADVQAAQLPADGWLALAREQIERREWRLAWRALYLATLSRLAAEGLLTLARFKTNLDYEREVGRRALARKEIVAEFARRRREFEEVWYGRAQLDEARVRAWLAEWERPVVP